MTHPRPDETEETVPEPPEKSEDENRAESTEEPVAQKSEGPDDTSLTVTDPDGTKTEI